jgi:hypothetical protein
MFAMKPTTPCAFLAGARKLEAEGRPYSIEKPIFAGVDISDGETGFGGLRDKPRR